jgi:hypothetical protein
MIDLATTIEVMAIRSAQASALRRLAMHPPVKMDEWCITNDHEEYDRRVSAINEKYDRMVADLQADIIDIPYEDVTDEPKQLPQ